MTRLLLKTYVLQLLLVTALVAAGVLLTYRRDLAAQRDYVDTVAGGVTALAADVLRGAAPSDRASRETALAAMFGFPVRLVPADRMSEVWDRLSESERAIVPPQLARDGHAVAFADGDAANGRELLLRSMPDLERVLVVGPLPLAPTPFPWTDYALLAGLGLGLWLSLRPLRRRLETFAAAARAFGRGETAARVLDTRKDALGDVGRAFDAMADRIAAQFEHHRALLRAVAHELRTPLARLRFAQELMLGGIDEPRAPHAAEARRSVDELETLVDELLMQARLEHGAPLATSVVDVGALLETLAADASASNAAIELVFDARGAFAVAEATLLRRALWNVLSNAMRHARSRVAVEASREDGGVVVTIDDDGPGIAPADRERVFDPFVRLDTSRDRRQGGVGLGLSIARQALRACGGSVVATQSPLGGSRFVLRLRVADAPSSAITAIETTSTRHSPPSRA